MTRSTERRFREDQKGFTLVELAIVIVILGVLAAVATPRFLNFSGDAETVSDEAAIAGIQTAMSTRFMHNRVTGASSADWITAVDDIPGAMQSGSHTQPVVQPQV